jgi:carboxypeptidase C (cathepsin A)
LWIQNKKVVGYYHYIYMRKRYVKVVGNLEFRIINNAGHLVPYDQPEVALNLI